METRTLVALAATLICAAKTQATSPVQTARAQERVAEPEVATEQRPTLPESPLAIARPLAMRDALRIELEGRENAPRNDAALFELSFDASPQQ